MQARPRYGIVAPVFRPRIAALRQRSATRPWSLALPVGVLCLALGARLLSERPTPAPPPPEAVAELATLAEPTPAPAPPAPPPAAPVSVPTSFAGIAAPPPEPPPRTGTVEYVVEPGDSLRLIAEQFRLRLETLVWANGIPNPDLILVGQKLRIPPADGVFYRLQPGDRLAEVAAQHGIELGAVVSANRLSDPDAVPAGAELFLPGARPLHNVALASSPGPAAAPEQESAELAALVPLPPNLDDLLSAGWLQTERPTPLYKTAGRDGRVLHELPAGARLERLEGFRNGRIQVRDPGDGRTRQAMTGWVNAVDLALGRAPRPRELPLAYPANTAMEIAHVFAPYRSQLDGSPYAEANCGPTALGMALEAFGIALPSRQLRQEVLAAQGISGTNVGTLLTALATVARRHGLAVHGLSGPDGRLHRWSLDDIRAQIAAGRPVIVQVRYRALPGRTAAAYFGDHYLLITGVLPDGFLYNDPLDHDGIGWDRVISPERLFAAMDASDRRFAYAAFAVSR